MPLGFGRGRRHARPAARFPQGLMGHAEHAASGILVVRDRRTASHARLALYRGGTYAVELEGFDPDPLARLVTAGVIDAETAKELEALARPEVEAVRRGLVTADALAAVHQELLLAAWGAVVAAEVDEEEWQPERTMDTGCTVPLPVADVLATIELRAQRQAATWAAVSGSAGPESAVLPPVVPGASLPSSLPEMRAVAGALDGRSTVDQVAGRLGLTRAEGVHLAAALVGAGLTRWEGQRGEGTGRLVVPEEFGQRGIVPEEFGQREPAVPVPLPSGDAGEDAGEVAQVQEELSRALAAQQAAQAEVVRLEERLRRLTAGSR
jgi:hypothetical protein